MAKNAGCTQREIDAMSCDEIITGLGEATDLIMLATNELASGGTLTDNTLAKMRELFDDQSCRKLILIIAWFNFLSRFLNGCRVPLETGDKLGDRTSPLN